MLVIILILFAIPMLSVGWFINSIARMKTAKKQGETGEMHKCKTRSIISGVIALVTTLGAAALCITFTLSIAHM